MKELIEKIKELRQNPYSEYERLSHNKAIDEILNIIQEQESKTFNPVECGFKVELNKDGKIEYWILEKGLNKYKIYHHRNNLFSITFENYHSKISNYLDVNVVNIIKIPNHHFGVELLKNLGLLNNDKIKHIRL